jgi:tetratricopeptide (TPR) repeat protein
MSQVSPGGRYVVTSIGAPAAGNVHQKENPQFAPGLSGQLFSMNYNGIAFTQVFYPTRGILAWYDRKTEKLRPLPGADELQHMQKAVEMAPDFADGHSYLGTALAKMGRFDEAIEEIQTAIKVGAQFGGVSIQPWFHFADRLHASSEFF